MPNAASDCPSLDDAPLSTSLKKLAQRGQATRYAKGAVLITEGDVGDTLYLLLSGRLKVYGSSASQDREVVYGHCEPGDYVGEMGLDGGARSASVQALEPSWCVRIGRQALLDHLREEPEFALELLTKVIRRVRSATQGLKQLALNDVYGRLRAQLQQGAKPQSDGSLWIEPARTHKDWAAEIGCSREMVSRVMKDLERGGYLVVEPQGLRLLRPLPLRW
ncbi:CRP/FNR family cyclic AMP-dependent transcriptional regulator [Inhella inkyongensis]|uniref:CRP/FNR family cyclic AMP-dependent transcriptional regulator n=1 Tax=Inhella inkyongensis TaxID=392593 RepID=A0A840S206_9BURK|nr:Crp/Fnr family transcriptional regulator [Inhella inkyongensis]MBB5203562.1 CRP/FNR family cyclic AMP-dependent transcriptional regulator [Inhella inkyongensis]